MNFVAIDFETANSDRDSVCEVGLTVVKDGRIVESLSYLVRPKENYFDSFNTNLHGIDAKKVKNEPEFDVVWDKIKIYIEGNYVIAHNSGFDISVLRNVLNQYQIEFPTFKYSCTYQMSKRAIKGLFSYRLDSVCKHLDIPLKHHQAKDDSLACAEIALKIFKEHSISDFTEIEKVFNLMIGSIYPGGYNPSLSISNNGKYKISDIEYNKEKTDVNNILFSKNVVFTGTLSFLIRKEAQKMVLEIGGNCTKGITSTTNYLVVGEQDYHRYGEGFVSSKMEKAKTLLEGGQDIELITEKHFLECFNN